MELLEIETQSDQERKLIESAQGLLNDPSAIELTYDPRDSVTIKINFACVRNEKYEIAIVLTGSWYEDGEGMLNKLEISYLDTSTQIGQMLRYSLGTNQIDRTLHNIIRLDDWRDGAIFDLNTYDFGDNITSDGVSKLMLNSLFNSQPEFRIDAQEKVVSLLKSQRKIHIKGGVEILNE